MGDSERDLQQERLTYPTDFSWAIEKGTDGLPEIVPEEAEIVRDIYRMYIEGRTTNYIAKSLTAQGVPTPARKIVW